MPSLHIHAIGFVFALSDESLYHGGMRLVGHLSNPPTVQVHTDVRGRYNHVQYVKRQHVLSYQLYHVLHRHTHTDRNPTTL